MDHSITSESEEAALSVDSPLTSDGDNLGGSSSGGTALKKGPWTSAEDAILVDYVKKHGEGNWNAVQKHSGLLRCGKSCRLRWANHLRPNLKKGAFTLEEERLIVELHARMGNKWARMAAHMPGRTDNEIKNYWNTRIKRRHRAGLPLYPPELCIQAQPENHYSPEIYGGDQRCQSILQNSGYKTPDAMFETLNSLPFTPEFSDYSSNGSLVNGFSSPQFCNFIPQTIGSQRHAQEQDESMSEYGADAPTEVPRFDRAQKYSCENNKLQSFGLCFSYTPDHTEKLLLPGVNHGSHFMSNDTFSASKPFLGAEKSELPSFQYEDTYLGVWDPPPESLDSLVRSPQSRPLPSWRASPRSSGLLEDLLYEAKALCKSGNQLSDKSAISPGGTPDGSALKTCSMEFKGYLDPTSPSDNSMESIFNGPTDGIGTSVEEKIPVWNANSEVDKSSVRRGQRKLDFSRPDALLGSCWLQERAPCSEQRGYINDITATFLVDDLGCESKSMSYGTSASASNSGIASCIWNNMPAACQISDFP